MSKSRDLADLPAGSGNIDINGGTIDGVTIGGASAGAITGTTITGTSFVSSGDMTFGDDDKAIFGTGSDLKIFHDGAGGQSYIQDVGTGDLNISSNGAAVKLLGAAGTDMLVANSGGSVSLYYNTAQKLATTATGIDVTGTVTADGLTVDSNTVSFNGTADQNLNLFTSNTGADNRINFGDADDADVGRIWYKHNGNSMIFYTNAAERMRIDSSGNLLVGTTTSLGTIGTYDGFGVLSNGSIFSAATSTRSIFSRRSTDGSVIDFRKDGTTVGSISVTGSATAYNTSSDYRLKENVVDMTGAIDRVKALPVRRFNFIADPDTTVDGFLAHEAQEIVPEAVIGEKDAVDKDGKPEYQGIDQSKLVPLLTGALKEAIARIETLEAEVATLKGA